MDIETIDRIRETLMSSKGSQELYKNLEEFAFPPDITTENSWFGAIKEIYREFFAQELKWIEDTSESPIERLFCTGVLLIAKTRYYNLLRFTETPKLPISEYQENARLMLKAADLWDKLLTERGLKWSEVDQLLDEMIEMGTVGKGESVNVDEIRKVHFLYQGLGFNDAFHLTMQPQLPVSANINGRVIRPDLYIWLPCNEKFKLIVECDGYSYHSNRNSFTADRKRDRVLKTLGYDVLRFSGAEIHKNPFGVAQELINYLEKKRPSAPYISSLHPSQKG